MKRYLAIGLASILSTGMAVNAAAGGCFAPVSRADLEKGIRYFKDLKPKYDNLEGKSFLNKEGYWETTVPDKNGTTTIAVFRTAGKRLLNVAFTSPVTTLEGLIPGAGSGDFGKLRLKNATAIIVSPDNPLREKPAPVAVSCLPRSIAGAIRAANRNIKSINLPTGFYTINRFQPGQSEFIDKVFDLVGLTNPVVSTVSMNAGNYKNLVTGKAGLSLAIFLTKNNGLSRLMELTQLFKTPKKATPVVVLSVAGGVAGLGKLGIAYKSPYLVMGKGPIKTSLAFKWSPAKRKLSGELSVGVGKAKNPVIIPGAIELKGVTMEGMEVVFGFETGGGDAVEISAGIEIEKMKLTTVKKTFEPVRMKLAMGAKGPLGGLFEMKSDDTIYMTGIAELAKIAVNSRPKSKIVPSAWKNKNVFKLLQLDKLPQIGISRPHIFLATPGQDDSTHLADMHEIFGAGIRVKGDLVVFRQKIIEREIALNVRDGFRSVFKAPGFKIGKMRLSNVVHDVKADLSGDLPYYKLHARLDIDDFTFLESEFKFSKDGFWFTRDDGCLPPMLRVNVKTKGFKSFSGGVKESSCADRIGNEIVKSAKVVNGAILKTSSQAANGTKSAARDVGKNLARAAREASNMAKKAGCDIDKFFGGHACKSDKAKKKRREAERKADRYRKIANPASCQNGWYWHHEYRRCLPAGNFKMLYYALDGNDRGRCLTRGGKQHDIGKGAILWDCIGNWNQLFTITPWKPGSHYVRIRDTYYRCLGFNPAADPGKRGAAVISERCNGNIGHRWFINGGRVIGYRNLCLRVAGPNKNGTGLVAIRCGNRDPKDGFTEWVATAPSPNPQKVFFAALNAPRRGILRASSSNYCLDKTASMLPRSVYHLWDCKKSNSNQQFSFAPVNGQWFVMVSLKSKMCVDTPNQTEYVGTQQYPCNYNSHQLWQARSPGRNYTDANTFKSKFQLLNSHSGLCLSVKKLAKGSKFRSQKCNAGDQRQLFKLIPLDPA